MKTHKCKKCGHEWVARTEKPKACPGCKRYDWKKEKAVKVVVFSETIKKS